MVYLQTHNFPDPDALAAAFGIITFSSVLYIWKGSERTDYRFCLKGDWVYQQKILIEKHDHASSKTDGISNGEIKNSGFGVSKKEHGEIGE